MEIKTLTIGVISTIIAAVLIVTVLVPACSESMVVQSNRANATEVLDLVDGDETHTIEKVNGAFTWDSTDVYTVHIYSDAGWIFVGASSINAQLVSADTRTTTELTKLDSASVTKIVLAPTAITVTSSGSTTVYNANWIYVTDASGEYGLIGGSEVYVENVDQLKFCRTFSTYLGVLEGNTTTYKDQSWTDYLITTSVEGGVGVTLPIVATPQWTLTSVIAPLHVTGENTVSSLVSLIPLLALMGVVMGVIGLWRNRVD